MKKIKLILIYILTCTLLVGCWNYNEIDQVEIVLGIGIDSHIILAKERGKLSESQYHVTYEIVGIESEKGQLKSRILKNEGDTFFRAIRKIIEKNGKRAYLAHMKILVISEELAKKDIREILDYTMRDVEYRPDVHVLITDNNKAEDIFQESEEVVSMKLNDALKNQNKIGTFESITVWNIIDKLTKKGYEPVIPLVRVTKEGEKIVHIIGGIAVFKGTKMVGKLTEDETLYYLFIDNEIKNQPLSMEYFYENNLGHVSVEIYKSNTKVTPVFKDDKISMKINIECNVSVNELSEEIDITSEKERIKLEEHIAKTIEKGVQDVILRAQKDYNSDIFGFGDLIKRKNNSKWKKVQDDWDSIFPTIPVVTNVNVNITRTALSSQSIKIDEY
ncbi:MAG: Ger(x)C family spore germination protein [Vallitalea sp.]|jgi:spore germination protein KC|nr:Ger(x)C family spore germination protein [Vallitalea sp.]